MKGSMVLKVAAFSLAAFILTGNAFAAPKAKTASKKSQGMEVLKDSKGKVYDLGGMNIIIADWWSPATPKEPSNAAEEATAEYRDWIQKTYNFTIQQVGIDSWGKHPETFINFATNGGKENYVFIERESAIAAPMKSKLFYNLSTLDCLDFSKDKWVKTVTALTTVDKNIYGMRAEAPEPKFGLYFNKRMLKEAGIDPESLYDMQAKGTWTWDAFETLCKKLTRDTNNDGVTDAYALTNFSVNFFNTVLASDNACYIGRDKDGKFYNATSSDAFLEAMNWGNAIIRKYEMPTPKDAKWDYSFAAFRNGQAAMSVSAVYQSNSMTEMKDDFGFVCFPKGPRAKSYVNVWDDNVYVIPACYDKDRAWKIAFAFNLYTEPTPGYDGPDDWKAAYQNSFRDSRSVDDTIALLKKNGIIWYNDLVPAINVGDIVYEVYGGTSTPAEKIEAVANSWKAYIDEANK